MYQCTTKNSASSYRIHFLNHGHGHNSIVQTAAHEYVRDFYQFFQLEPMPGGTVRVKSDPERLQHILAWWNRNVLLIGLVTGIRVGPFEELSEKLLVHVYSIAYVGALHMSRILGEPMQKDYTTICLTCKNKYLANSN